MLAVGREGEVLLAHGPAAADLRRLLTEQGGPDAQLALALQGGGLDVDAPDEHEVAVQPAVLVVGEVDVVVGVGDALSLGGEQLDRHLAAAHGGDRRLGQSGRIGHCGISSGDAQLSTGVAGTGRGRGGAALQRGVLHRGACPIVADARAGV